MPKAHSLAGLVLPLLVATTAIAQPIPAGPHFESPREYLAAGTSALMLVADFTGSGRVDVLAPGARFRSDGTGTLVAVSSIGGALSRDGRCIADFDGDGRTEAVGTGTTRDYVGLWEIDEAGVSRYRGFFSSLGYWNAFAAADFDGDGDVDVAAGADLAFPYGPDNLILGINPGDGRLAFFPKTLPRRIGARIERLAAADLNGDGAADLVGSDPVENRTWLLFGVGDGTFGEPVTLGAASGGFLRTTDVDGDGNADVVSCATGSSVIETRLGTGTGSFGAPISIVSPTVPTVIETGDVNGDGLADIVFVDAVQRPRLRSALFTPSGGFAPYVETRASYGIGSLDLVDLDEDGVLDVIVGKADWSSFRVQRGRPDGGFEDVPRVGVGPDLFDVVVGSFDAESPLDVAYYRADSATAGVGVLPGDGCAFGPRTAPESPLVIRDPVRGDFNEDGLDDLAGTNPAGSIVLFADPSGTFPRLAELPAPNVKAVTIADVDADGNEDLVVAISFGVSTYFGDGAGAFGPAVTIGGLETGLRCAAGDFTGDGLPDLAVGHIQSTTIYAGDGAGGFVEIASLSAGLPNGALAARDLNGDGLADLVLSPLSGTLVFVQDGTGAFAPRQPLPGPASVGALRVADFNADGAEDVVVIRTSEGGASLFLGDGFGGFAAGESYVTGALWISFDVADVDGDGFLDLVGLDRSEQDVVILHSASPLARARRGNVNEGAGLRADVLYVNGAVGADCRRRVALAPADPLEVSVTATPAGGRRFALYAWTRRAALDSVRALPGATGLSVLPMPTNPDPIAPREIWNNVGREAVLGVPTRPSSPAPSRVLSLPGGLGRAATFTLQGVIRDPGAPNGRAAVTNAIEVTVR